MATKIRKQAQQIMNKYAENTDYEVINKIIKVSGKLDNFEVSKTMLINISKWALNGESDEEIRQNLDLTMTQWKTLITVCPSLLMIMEHSRSLADVVIAGSLYETAIGGKKIKKQMPVKVKDYNEQGRVIGEHYETYEYEEELEPNAYLLKYLAEHKLSEKFGDKKIDNTREYKDIVESMSVEDEKLFSKSIESVIDGDKK